MKNHYHSNRITAIILLSILTISSKSLVAQDFSVSGNGNTHFTFCWGVLGHWSTNNFKYGNLPLQNSGKELAPTLGAALKFTGGIMKYIGTSSFCIIPDFSLSFGYNSLYNYVCFLNGKKMSLIYGHSHLMPNIKLGYNVFETIYIVSGLGYCGHLVYGFRAFAGEGGGIPATTKNDFDSKLSSHYYSDLVIHAGVYIDVLDHAGMSLMFTYGFGNDKKHIDCMIEGYDCQLLSKPFYSISLEFTYHLSN